MKLKIIALFVCAGSWVLQSSPVLAQSDISIRLQALQRQCTPIKVLLRRLHTNDAVLRVNAGQVYNQLSSQLMARFNGRLALNQVDSSQFVEITKHYDQALSRFSNEYKAYEEAMSGLLDIRCDVHPAEFYAQLVKARDNRYVLSSTIKDMNRIVGEYRAAVEHLQQRVDVQRG